MLVVNVSKHGAGPSFDRLKDKFPSLLGDVGFGEFRYHHDHLAVDDEDVERFSAAIIQFWESVPERLGTIGASVSVPKAFQQAWQADLEARSASVALRR